MALEGQLYPIGYLPNATENQLGVVQVGDGLDVSSEGVLSLSNSFPEALNLFNSDKFIMFREGVPYFISAYTIKQFINFVDLLINWVDVDNAVWDGLTDVGWDNIV